MIFFLTSAVAVKNFINKQKKKQKFGSTKISNKFMPDGAWQADQGGAGGQAPSRIKKYLKSLKIIKLNNKFVNKSYE